MSLAVVFFVLGPAIEAGLAPWLLTGWETGDGWLASATPLRVAGALLIVAGVAIVLWCTADLATRGAGTLSPAVPTQRLVTTGAYRRVRHPMYLATAAAIAGQGLMLARPVLLAGAGAYCATLWTLATLREEPALAHRFGADYDEYRRTVPAWLPRFRRTRAG